MKDEWVATEWGTGGSGGALALTMAATPLIEVAEMEAERERGAGVADMEAERERGVG